jgi:hypothetical protein
VKIASGTGKPSFLSFFLRFLLFSGFVETLLLGPAKDEATKNLFELD